MPVIQSAGGQWRQIPVTPPLVRQPGDVYEFAGGVLRQYRAGELIAERTLEAGEPFVPGPDTGTGLLETVFFFEAAKMPGTMATLVEVEIEEGTGKYFYRFSDGTEREYATRAAALVDVQDKDTDPNIPRDFLVLASLRQDANGANAEVMVGRSCTVDCAAIQPVSLSLGAG